MNEKRITVLAISIVMLSGLVSCTQNPHAPSERLDADFDTNPLETGWQGVRHNYRPFVGTWVDSTEDSHVRIEKGGWGSPVMRCQEGTIYRVSFDAKTRKPGYWRVFFYDRKGKELDADHYSRVYRTSGKWEQQSFVFEARHESRYMKLGFTPKSGTPLFVDDVKVEAIEPTKALDWIRSVKDQLQPVDYDVPENRWTQLQKTRRILEKGGTLRIVVLGDSIANDITNSLFHLQLEENQPECDIEIIRSIKSGTGCGYYQRNDRVRDYVLKYDPDLVIIGGISHGRNVKPIRQVIHQIREKSDSDILVLSGAISKLQGYRTWRDGRRVDVSSEQHKEDNKEFRRELRQMCAEEQVAFLDMRDLWTNYVDENDRAADWYRRDSIHANARGKQVLGQFLVRYFELPERASDARE